MVNNVMEENLESVTVPDLNTDPLTYTTMDVSSFGVLDGVPVHSTVVSPSPSKDIFSYLAKY